MTAQLQTTIYGVPVTLVYDYIPKQEATLTDPPVEEDLVVEQVLVEEVDITDLLESILEEEGNVYEEAVWASFEEDRY
jgi:hypothetical protein